MTAEQKIIFDEVTEGLDPSLIEIYMQITEQVKPEDFDKWIKHIKTERQK